MTNREIPAWRRLLTEAVIIVGSILLAFAIDAWWEEARNDRATNEILRLVALETATNQGRLAQSIARHEAIIEAISVAQDNNTSARVHYTAVIEVELFAPNTDALETLVATGMLGEIDDIELRIALGALGGLADQYRSKELGAAFFRDAARQRIARLGTLIYTERPDTSPVYTDIEFLNLLTLRKSEEISSVAAARELAVQLDEIAVLLGTTDDS